MTNYKIVREDENYIIEVKGHSMFSKYGSDIVCASISTAIYMTVNAIELLEPSYNRSSIILEEGYFRISVNKNYKNATKLLENLEFTLKDLENKFPKNIKN